MNSDHRGDISLSERFEHTYKIASSPSFLAREGLGNEVPYFILPYPADQEPAVGGERRRLVNRLRIAGIAVGDIDLWKLACVLWEETGVFDQMLAAESSMPKATFGEAIGNVISPSTHLSPRIVELVAGQVPEPQIVFLSNVGRLFPLVRAHTILNTLQPFLSHIPLVLIFPGSYKQSPTQGSSLQLFDRMTDDDYYRAFDLLDLEVS